MLIQYIYISLYCKIIYYKTMLTPDNENYIYYRNLLFRFIKEKNIECIMKQMHITFINNI